MSNIKTDFQEKEIDIQLDRKLCNGCIVKRECSWPTSLYGIQCPCIICLIKVMCPQDGACKAYREYEKFLKDKLGKNIWKLNNTLVISPIIEDLKKEKNKK